MCLLTFAAVLGLLAVMAVRANASPAVRAPPPVAAPTSTTAPPAATAPPTADRCGSDPAGCGAEDDGAADDGDAIAMPASDRANPDPAAVRAVMCGAPPVASVIAAAYRAAGLDGDPTPGWRRRARLAALVPRIGVRDGQDATWHDVSDPTIGYVSLFAVTATWQLDRIVYDRDELRIASIATARHRERRRLGMLVVHAYYGWLRARAAARGDPRLAVAADEAAAVLDAMTDGWFTGALHVPP